ncbi:MAG: polysaccharide biosynthesis/export family protein [Prevotellaceae bacterium]|nr:polysaccharide biosynthesis/export family protein [Prevotellaceae bacterium]
MNKYLKYLLLITIVLSSCNSQKKIAYMQDLDNVNKSIKVPEISIQPQDMLSIVVSSKEPELALPFNLPIISYQGVGESYMGQQRLLGYTVNRDGDIDFPVLGKLHVEGLTRYRLEQFIKEKIIAEGYIKDPVVTVQLMNLRVTVNGEVTRPGTYEIKNDHITLFEALSMAGDLTIYGRRDNVKVIREKNGERTAYQADLRTANIFESPVYYLQQNDIIYVTPNRYRSNQTNNAGQVQQINLWISIASFIMSVAVLVFR